MKNILITGGSGFIGSHFIEYCLEQHPDYRLINLDKLTYAGSLDNLAAVEGHSNYHFIEGDITNQELIRHIFKQFDITDVIHFAAETHVDRSIQDANSFIKTNVEGTFVLLEAAHCYWLQRSSSKVYSEYQQSRFLQVSTDEVYGSLRTTGFFTEETAYAPNNPYSATKAAGDFLGRSYYHTFGLPVITTHGSNTYGPRQHSEKLIPHIIYKALELQPIPIHGRGTAIRDWLYVADHCRGIDAAFHKGQPGQHYNLGGGHEMTNLSMAQQVCQLLDEYRPSPDQKSYQLLLTFVTDRPGNDQRYALDISKAKADLNWQPTTDLDGGLRKTVAWYIEKIAQELTI
jgi:dTDP-glucose 4,6-dehydratase